MRARHHLITLASLSLSLTALSCGRSVLEGAPEVIDPLEEQDAFLVGRVRAYTSQADCPTDYKCGMEAGELSISRREVKFNEDRVGSRQKRSITISNSGDSNLRIDDLRLIDEQVGLFGRTTDELRVADFETEWLLGLHVKDRPIYVAPGAEFELRFVWEPRDTRSDNMTLILETSDPDNRYAHVRITSPEITPEINLDDELLFPQTPVGEQMWQLLWVENRSHGELELERVEIDPPSSAFAVSYPDPEHLDVVFTDQITNPPTIPPFGKAPIRVAFAPTTRDQESARLIIRTNDPAARSAFTQLAGNLAAPCLTYRGGERTYVTRQGHPKINFGEVPTYSESIEPLDLINCSTTHTLDIKLELDTGEYDGFDLFSSSGEPLRSTHFALPPGGIKPLRLHFSPEHYIEYTGQIKLETNDPLQPNLSLLIAGEGDWGYNCTKQDVVIGGEPSRKFYAGDVLELTSYHEYNDSYTDFRWLLMHQPDGSNATLHEVGSDNTRELTLDVPGAYTIRAEKYSGERRISCRDDLEIETSQDISIELTWSSPGDDHPGDNVVADLDLYLKKSTDGWSGEEVAWSAQPRHDWGVQGASSDDPVIDNHHKERETIAFSGLVEGQTYQLGVHMPYDARLGPAHADLDVYLRGERVASFKDVVFDGNGSFWHVMDIDWQRREPILIDKHFDQRPE